MNDPRYQRLAELLVGHSMRVSRGEKVLIEAFDIPAEFTTTLIDAVAAAGGEPMVSTYQQTVLRSVINNASAEQMTAIGQVELGRMKAVQCYAGIRGSHNIAEMSDVPREKMDLYERLWWKPVHSDWRVPKTKWVVLRWPHPSMAQSAGMSTEAFEDFYFRVCAGVDYGAMKTAMGPLLDLMRKTGRVAISGPGTDLKFSIKGIDAVGCWGDRNIPDGEAFTCPVKESINGMIQFNAETLYRGTVFADIRLVFKNGKVVEAQAGGDVGQSKKLNEILDSDAGARYVGEWSLAFNPHILKPMRDILFDEKIAGSFHLTPGQAYEEADNGNRSQIHWDMVCIQRPECGGGEIRFDDKLIRKDGLFVLAELAGLNPERLGSA
jgi:aminopeptidase